VVTPIKDGPAYQAGIRSGDLLVRLACPPRYQGDGPKVLSTRACSVGAINEALLGKAGSRVKLTVQRDDVTKPLTVEVERGRVAQETVFGVRRQADASWNFLLDAKAGIGYLRIKSFQRDTPGEVKAAVRALRKQGLRGLVLDLRFNPGGLLNSARKIASTFAGTGPLFSIRTRTGVADRLMGEAAGSERDFRMACLVNGQTTLTSELLAACLQDHRRAVIVGERTPGEVTIHNCQDLRGGLLYIATAVFCRGDGGNLSKMMTGGKENEQWGVQPDQGFVLKLPAAEQASLAEHLRRQRILLSPGQPAAPAFKDRQLELALRYLRKAR